MPWLRFTFIHFHFRSPTSTTVGLSEFFWTLKQRMTVGSCCCHISKLRYNNFYFRYMTAFFHVELLLTSFKNHSHLNGNLEISIGCRWYLVWKLRYNVFPQPLWVCGYHLSFPKSTAHIHMFQDTENIASMDVGMLLPVIPILLLVASIFHVIYYIAQYCMCPSTPRKWTLLVSLDGNVFDVVYAS